MSDQVRAVAASLRQGAAACIEDYHQHVVKGKVLTDHDGTVANFATVYMASRLVHNGYADAFATDDYWNIEWLAEAVRTLVETDLLASATLPDGQFGLDLAFLMLHQVDWVVVAQALQDVITQQKEAMLRLKGKEVPSIEIRPMSPEEWERLTEQG